MTGGECGFVHSSWVLSGVVLTFTGGGAGGSCGIRSPLADSPSWSGVGGSGPSFLFFISFLCKDWDVGNIDAILAILKGTV